MKIQVLCIFGGCSLEHEISILSALSLFEEEFQHYDLIPLYIDKNHKWYSGELLKQRECYIQKEYQHLNEVCLKKRKNQLYLCEKGFLRRKKKIDMILPLIHGKYGEDGSIQGYFNMLQIPYVSPSLQTCALAHDKGIMKYILQEKGISVVPFFEIHKDDNIDEALYEKTKRLKYPLIIKPTGAGSSIGIQIVNNVYEFKEALTEVFQYDEHIIVEKYYANVKEYHGAIIKNGNKMKISQIEEIKRHDDIFSFDEKYIKDRKNEWVQPHIASELYEQIHQLLMQCAYAIRLEGMVRIDFLYVEDTLYVNEINVIPGSLAKHLWKPQMNMDEFFHHLMKIAYQQYDKSFTPNINIDFQLLHHKK